MSEQQQHHGFVVLHSMLEKWSRGDVVTRKHLEDAQATLDRAQTKSQKEAAEVEFTQVANFFHDTDRLTNLGAVRPATDAEVKAGWVDVSLPEQKIQRSLDQLERENADLRAERDRLSAENERRAGQFGTQPVPAGGMSAEELRRTQEENERLRAENEALKAQQQPPPMPPAGEPPAAQPVEEEEEMGFRKRRK